MFISCIPNPSSYCIMMFLMEFVHNLSLFWTTVTIDVQHRHCSGLKTCIVTAVCPPKTHWTEFPVSFYSRERKAHVNIIGQPDLNLDATHGQMWGLLKERGQGAEIKGKNCSGPFDRDCGFPPTSSAQMPFSIHTHAMCTVCCGSNIHQYYSPHFHNYYFQGSHWGLL